MSINDAILEVVALTRTEAANNGVLVRTQLAEGCRLSREIGSCCNK